MAPKRQYSSRAEERLASLLLSFCLHGLLLAAILLWPNTTPPKVDLALPTIDLTQVTIGGGPKRAATPSPAEAAKPEPAPQPTPEPQPEPKPEPKPENIVQVPVKPEEKVPPAPEPKPQAKPEPKPEDILKQALAEAKSTAKPTPQVKQGQSLVDDALRQSAEEAKIDQTGLGGGGGDGIGILGTYEESVVSRVRPHFFTNPRADGKVFQVAVTITIGDDGTITDTVILNSSGNSKFDLDVLRAIRDAGRMEPPPAENLKKITIPFDSHMLAAPR